MGRLVVLLIAALVMAQAAAQQPAKPEADPTVVDMMQRAMKHVEAVLAAPDTGIALSRDPAFFSPLFLKYPKQRGWGMAYFVRMGKPLAPATFGIKCSTGALNVLTYGVGKRADGKTSPYACPLLVECKAQTTRTNGCFAVDLDVCVRQDGIARINKVTGASFATELDFRTPAKVSDCSREAVRRAKAGQR